MAVILLYAVFAALVLVATCRHCLKSITCYSDDDVDFRRRRKVSGEYLRSYSSIPHSMLEGVDALAYSGASVPVVEFVLEDGTRESFPASALRSELNRGDKIVAIYEEEALKNKQVGGRRLIEVRKNGRLVLHNHGQQPKQNPAKCGVILLGFQMTKFRSFAFLTKITFFGSDFRYFLIFSCSFASDIIFSSSSRSEAGTLILARSFPFT